MKWSDLTMKERSDLMSLFLKAGVGSLSDMKRIYDEGGYLFSGTSNNPENDNWLVRARKNVTDFLGITHHYDDYRRNKAVSETILEQKDNNLPQYAHRLPDGTISYGEEPLESEDGMFATMIPAVGIAETGYTVAKGLITGHPEQAAVAVASEFLPDILKGSKKLPIDKKAVKRYVEKNLPEPKTIEFVPPSKTNDGLYITFEHAKERMNKDDRKFLNDIIKELHPATKEQKDALIDGILERFDKESIYRQELNLEPLPFSVLNAYNGKTIELHRDLPGALGSASSNRMRIAVGNIPKKSIGSTAFHETGHWNEYNSKLGISKVVHNPVEDLYVIQNSKFPHAERYIKAYPLDTDYYRNRDWKPIAALSERIQVNGQLRRNLAKHHGLDDSTLSSFAKELDKVPNEVILDELYNLNGYGEGIVESIQRNAEYEGMNFIYELPEYNRYFDSGGTNDDWIFGNLKAKYKKEHDKVVQSVIDKYISSIRELLGTELSYGGKLK